MCTVLFFCDSRSGRLLATIYHLEDSVLRGLLGCCSCLSIAGRSAAAARGSGHESRRPDSPAGGLGEEGVSCEDAAGEVRRSAKSVSLGMHFLVENTPLP